MENRENSGARLRFDVTKSIDNPNIVSMTAALSEHYNLTSPARHWWRYRNEGERPLNLEFEVQFRTPVLLYGGHYDRVKYLLDSLTNECIATFFTAEGRKMPFYPMTRTRFEYMLCIVSLPEEVLTEEELVDRRKYEEQGCF